LRAGPRAEKTAAQKRFTAVAPFVGIIAVVIMVSDHRFGWSPAVPAWLSLVGDALIALGIVIYFLVIRENRFAAATVEIAEGQTVVSTGPYAVVRHPMYAGAILFLLGVPIALGSWWDSSLRRSLSAASCGGFWMRRNFSARIRRGMRSTRARSDTASSPTSGSYPQIRSV
jgi:protein-S-isoprenylcysteine O-methyltransferase Ste14